MEKGPLGEKERTPSRATPLPSSFQKRGQITPMRGGVSSKGKKRGEIPSGQSQRGNFLHLLRNKSFYGYQPRKGGERAQGGEKKKELAVVQQRKKKRFSTTL